jgi:2-polyprenyl-3-methyl-5-hydroxy-6-metoxy-1,4-benzoquinol methylase
MIFAQHCRPSGGSKLADMNDSRDAHERQIIRSWNTNAGPWARAIQAGNIRSRKVVTDKAILDAVLGVNPSRVVDLGCGEGWLARALSGSGVQVTGIDAVPELIAEAARLGGAEFQVCDYDTIASRRWRSASFSAAVCNFSLLGKESVESLLGGVGEYLDDPGYLIIQTLHPVCACGDHPYLDGWRPGNWLGFGTEFSDPAPWYFRTLESWWAMLRRSGFELQECLEPTAPAAITPASVIFICKARVREQTQANGAV